MNQKNCCNSCGRILEEEHGILREDALFVKKSWGYFSKKDLEIHEFILCEDCYDRLIAGFQKPVSVTEKTEILNETERK
jgi:ribosomal-protein-alanine N-acetyltransferase